MKCLECGLPFTMRKMENIGADGEIIIEEVWACWVCYDEELSEDQRV